MPVDDKGFRPFLSLRAALFVGRTFCPREPVRFYDLVLVFRRLDIVVPINHREFSSTSSLLLDRSIFLYKIPEFLSRADFDGDSTTYKMQK